MYVESAKIYVLIDPRNQEIRYVGKTESSLDDRLYHHIWDAASGKSTAHKARWLQKLHRLGYEPMIVLVQEVPTINWPDAERYWINYYRSVGCPLTNATDGGDSGPSLPGALNPFYGKRHTEDSLVKMRGRNVSGLTRTKISVAKKGKTLINGGTFIEGYEVPEHVRKERSQRMTGVPMGEQNRARISASLKGKPKIPCGHNDWHVRENGSRYCRTCAHNRYVQKRDQQKQIKI